MKVGRGQSSAVRQLTVGVAMGDARPEVRVAADWIAPPTAEAGLAAAMRRFVLF